MSTVLLTQKSMDVPFSDDSGDKPSSILEYSIGMLSLAEVDLAATGEKLISGKMHQ